jgi:two-component system sensor histidine kinase AgrC
MEFFGFLLVNTFFTLLTAIMIYYFLKINFKVKGNILFLVLSFGLINGIVASLWTNLFKLSHNLDTLKLVLLIVISILIIKFTLKVNWLKSILGFVVVTLGVGLGNAFVPSILNINAEDALSNLSIYIVGNIIIYAIAILFVAIIQIIKLLIKKLSIKDISESKN